MPTDPLDEMSNETPPTDTDPLQDWIDRVHRLPEVRHELVETVRNAIRHDEYDEKEGLEKTLSRLFDEAELADGEAP